MSPLRQALCVAVGGAALVVGSWSLPILDSPERACTAPQTCYEDQACWDCRTMGNEICGTEVKP